MKRVRRVPNVRPYAWLDGVVDGFWLCLGAVGSVLRLLTGIDE